MKADKLMELSLNYSFAKGDTEGAAKHAIDEALRSGGLPSGVLKEWLEGTICRVILHVQEGSHNPEDWTKWAEDWRLDRDRSALEAGLVADTLSLWASQASNDATRWALQSGRHIARAAEWLDRAIEGEQDHAALVLKCAVYAMGYAAGAKVEGTQEQRHAARDAAWSLETEQQYDSLLDILQKQEESISDKLFNAAETNLERAVAEMAGERGEDCAAFVKDVLSGGCANGTVGELIYYEDTVAFYQKHKKEIQKLVTELMRECGEDSPMGLFGDRFDSADPFCEDVENQNLLAWFGFEEALRTLANRIELDI